LGVVTREKKEKKVNRELIITGEEQRDNCWADYDQAKQNGLGREIFDKQTFGGKRDWIRKKPIPGKRGERGRM